MSANGNGLSPLPVGNQRTIAKPSPLTSFRSPYPTSTSSFRLGMTPTSTTSVAKEPAMLWPPTPSPMAHNMYKGGSFVASGPTLGFGRSSTVGGLVGQPSVLTDMNNNNAMGPTQTQMVAPQTLQTQTVQLMGQAQPTQVVDSTQMQMQGMQAIPMQMQTQPAQAMGTMMQAVPMQAAPGQQPGQHFILVPMQMQPGMQPGQVQQTQMMLPPGAPPGSVIMVAQQPTVAAPHLEMMAPIPDAGENEDVRLEEAPIQANHSPEDAGARAGRQLMCEALDATTLDSLSADGQPLPSPGSALHGTGRCNPCAWFWKPGGCQNGKMCTYCHLCPEGEMKSRKKAKVIAIRLGALEPADKSAPQARANLKLDGFV